jgi:hypothetical protein
MKQACEGSGSTAARSIRKSERIAISLASITSSHRPKTLELGATKTVRNFIRM